MEYSPPNYDRDFGGKVAIVTGAASGIGKAIAKALASHGANVCIFDKDFEKGIYLAREIEERGLDSDAYDVDVSNKESVKRGLELVLESHGIPWILVNNAGVENNKVGNLIDMPYEEMMRIINTNLVGCYNMIREVGPHMRSAGGGRIVNISSVQAIRSCTPGTPYQSTKAGILPIARNMTIDEARKYNIRTNTIIPGAIKTEGMGNARGESPGELDKLRSVIPIGRRGHPEEVAHAALFLLSESASYIHGAELIVDGGLLTHFQPGGFTIPSPPVKNDPDRN